ncbi:hypothetical protein [Bacillus mycoides]|uniref:hypothetical protein n=1 Tax=Bacillus mycoides TaxID=1405 RepID=UPI001C021F78|nr:hypothetical protein [Bacillus mycoides]QWG92864.1 hypothetical protein EXW40_27785 [Bacillus mycoides]
MNGKVKYKWTTSIFNKGEEWTTGYFETRILAIDDLIREGTSGFILLDNPESEGDIQDIEFIKIAKDKQENVIVSEIICYEKAKTLYYEGAFDTWKERFELLP